MLQDFKALVMKGSVLDLAVAVIVGAAFGAIVTSMVNDVLMPPIGLLLGKVDFKELYFSLDGQYYPTLAAARSAGAPILAYGQFLNTVANFLIVAFVIFLLVRSTRQFEAQRASTAPVTKDCVYCCSPIPMKASRCPHCTSAVGLSAARG
ncbi:MAG: large conductance mechanosensitive channel protein MscL [Bryobacterales bacterium]|nr:large conductance mechanosensitive channel protein MscL [Bryobacterales bacterium]